VLNSLQYSRIFYTNNKITQAGESCRAHPGDLDTFWSCARECRRQTVAWVQKGWPRESLLLFSSGWEFMNMNRVVELGSQVRNDIRCHDILDSRARRDRLESCPHLQHNVRFVANSSMPPTLLAPLTESACYVHLYFPFSPFFSLLFFLALV